jgi:hypothetical protein
MINFNEKKVQMGLDLIDRMAKFTKIIRNITMVINFDRISLQVIVIRGMFCSLIIKLTVIIITVEIVASFDLKIITQVVVFKIQEIKLELELLEAICKNLSIDFLIFSLTPPAFLLYINEIFTSFLDLDKILG